MNTAALPSETADMSLLAVVSDDSDWLTVRRLNRPFWADIRSGIGFWLVSLYPPLGLDAFVLVVRWVGGSVSIPFNVGMFLLWAALTAAMATASLLPYFLALRKPCQVTFDRISRTVLVNGKAESGLHSARILLQDGFGPSRRAFRIVLQCNGQSFVMAQTQRFTLATFIGKEYPSVATSEGLERKYWFNRWADYAGATTGYDPAWPEYREIFALYANIKQYMEAFHS